MSTSIEVFAEITCPFAYVGIRHVVEYLTDLDEPVDVVLRAWPLEWVNGTTLAFDGVETKAAALCEQLDVDLFTDLRSDTWPSSTVAAHCLTSAAYEVDAATGLAVGAALRTLTFEDGADIGDLDVLASVASTHDVEFDPQDDTAVRAEYADGQRRGVQGSPHYFVGSDDFFCPALDIGKDADDHLLARFDPSGLARFLASVGS